MVILFSTLRYISFLVIVVGFYWLLKKKNYQNLFLLFMSYVFYATWDWRFLFLIIISTMVDYIAGAKIASSDSKKSKKCYLIMSICVNLIILGFFKYYNFFAQELYFLLNRLHIELHMPIFNIILPIGISFYTFQSMSYTIDIYRDKLSPAKSFTSFGLFVSFFPQLIAGPIERAVNMLPQIEYKRNFNLNQFLSGIDLILWGLLKKVFIADNIAYYVNMIFDLRETSTLLFILGGFGFGIQVFADFSAYSNIARGSAKLFGLELIKNFNKPYLAVNIVDFWLRWHISLSSWIKDYLYIPLGGSHCSRLRYILNMLIVWIAVGLWHGAAWNFIACGLYFGILIICYKLIIAPLLQRCSIYKKNFKVLSILTTFIFVNIGFLFFRIRDIRLLPSYFSLNSFARSFKDLKVAYILIAIFLFYSLPFLIGAILNLWKQRVNFNIEKRIIFLLFYATVVVIILIIFHRSNNHDFIYFQF